MDKFVWEYCPNCSWFGKVRSNYRFCDTCGWEFEGWQRRKVVLQLEAKVPVVAPLQLGCSKEENKIDEVEEILKGHKTCVTGT